MWHTPRLPGRILFSPRDRGPTGSRRASHRRRSAVFRLERLEDRLVLSTVTSLDDSGPGTLRDAITNAAPSEVIDFAPGLHGTITLTRELLITDDLTIDGPGADRLTVSGDGASRVFDISDGATPTKVDTEVNIDGLTITDGLAAGNAAPVLPSCGGGILNFGNLTLSEVVVSDCLAVGDASANPHNNKGFGLAMGGGVYNENTLTVSDSSFTRDQALGGSDSHGNDPSKGSFLGSGMGGGLANTGVAKVRASQFTSNLAQGGNRSSGTVSFAGVTGGGAIANLGIISGNKATLDVSDHSSFTNNQAVGGNDNTSRTFPGIALGGAIVSHRFSYGADLNVGDSTFSHNKAIGGNYNLAQPGTSNGPNIASGGGIFIAGSTSGTMNTISRCTLDHNQSVGGQGLASVPEGKLGDVGPGNAGGISVAYSGTNATIKDCTIEHNQAIGGQAVAGGNGGDAHGGGIYNHGGTAQLTVTGCIIDHNQAQGGRDDTSGLRSNGGSGFGGGVCNDSATTISVTASSLAHNLAIGAAGSNGGDGGDGLGGGFYNSGTATLTGNVIEFNLALGGEGSAGGTDGDGSGGGVYWVGTPVPADIINVNVIRKNHASKKSTDNIGP
jgi:hypothetical protein